MSENIRERIIEIVKKNIKTKDGQLSDESNFVDDLGADSLSLFEVILNMEREFGCEIPEKDANQITTIKEAVSYIEQKIKNGETK